MTNLIRPPVAINRRILRLASIWQTACLRHPPARLFHNLFF
ncbi:MAG TPA: hypothetical protein VK985_09160 [Rariglobus sp.]|nr:hypothetical protein [Rariglobus sp.]